MHAERTVDGEGLKPAAMDKESTEHLEEYLAAGYLIRRIKDHFMTCATSMDLSDEDRISRVSSCVTALRLIFITFKKKNPTLDELDEVLK